jgi:hypothetical protein
MDISSMFRSRKIPNTPCKRDWSLIHPTKWVEPSSLRMASNPSTAAIKVGLSLPFTTTSYNDPVTTTVADRVAELSPRYGTGRRQPSPYSEAAKSYSPHPQGVIVSSKCDRAF